MNNQCVIQASVGHLNYVLATKPAVMEVIFWPVPGLFECYAENMDTVRTLCWVVGNEATDGPSMWPFPKCNQIQSILFVHCVWQVWQWFNFWFSPPPILSPAIQEAFQLGIYWAHTNTVHKSTALKLVHDLTSPRWKEGSDSEVITLDEEGYVEADITLGAFPGRQKVRETTLSWHPVTTAH